MTEFNLGVLSAYATINDAPFAAAYPRLVAKFRTLFGEAAKTAAGFDKLDASLAEVADTSSAASASLSRVGTSSTRAGAAQAKAAAQAKVFADAQERVNATMTQYAGASSKVQAAALRVAAAEDRLNAVLTSETATVRQLASANAGLISAQRSLATAAEASGGRYRASMVATAAAGKTLTHSLSLPLAAIAAVSIDVSAKFQSSMERIRTQAGGTQHDVTSLTKQVLGMKDAQQGPNDLAAALYHLKSVGLGNAQAMRALRTGSDLAAVGQANLEDTVNALAGAWRTGIKGAQNFGKEAALVNAIIGAGNMTLTDFTDALSTGVLASARTFGVSLKSVGAALALFTDEGVPANTAATRLRMSFSLLAAPSAKASKMLDSIGLSGTKLGEDLRKPNGILAAVTDLRDHLAGLSDVAKAQFLSEAFGGGRSSSAILSMVQQVDTLRMKWDQVGGSVSKYGADVKAQQATAAAQFHRALATLERDAVELGKDLLPIGTQLVGDIDKVAKGFDGWSAGEKKAAVDAGLILLALGPVLGIIGRIGKAFALVFAMTGLRGFITGLRGVELAEGAVATGAYKAGAGLRTMGTAGKLATSAVAGIGIGLSIGLMTRQASDGAKALGALGSAAAGAAVGFSVGGPWGAAIGGTLGALSDLTAAFTGTSQAAKAAAASIAQDVGELTSAVEEDSGAVGRNTKAWIANKLTTDGVLDQAKRLGLSYQTITNEITGSLGAFKKVTDSFAQSFKHVDLFDASTFGGPAAALDILKLGGALDTAKGKAKEYGKEFGILRGGAVVTAKTQARIASTTRDQVPAFTAAAGAMGKQNTQTKALTESTKKLTTTYLGLVSAELASAQSQDQFEEAVRGVTTQLKGAHDQLDTTSKAGLANRDSFLNAASAAQSFRDSQRQAGVSLADADTRLISNVKQLRAAAVAAGANKGAVDKLLGSLHLLPNQIRTHLLIDTNPASAALQRIMNQINALHPTIHVGITGGHTLGLARGGSLPEGVSAVGERGTELAVKSGPNVAIVPHGPAMRYLAATGSRIQGFASGTGPGAQTAVTKAGAALTNVALDKTGFNWTRFATQIQAAAVAVKDAIAAGATKAQVASLTARLARDRVEGNKLERALGRSILHGFGSLGHMAGDTSTTGSDFRGALSTLDQQLRHAGLPPSFVKGLAGENQAILGIVAARNVAARHLAAANAALAAAQKKMHSDERSFAGAVVGSFDITGQVDANGHVTAGSEVAAGNQAVTRAKAFFGDMKKLIGLKIFPNRYLRSILALGPTPEGLATAAALAGMPHSELKQLAADNRELSKLGNQLGTLGGRRLDQPAVNRAQRRVDHYQKIEERREKHLDDALTHMADRIEHSLEHLHLEGKLGLTAGQLSLIVDTGKSQNAKAGRSTPPRPGGRP